MPHGVIRAQLAIICKTFSFASQDCLVKRRIALQDYLVQVRLLMQKSILLAVASSGSNTAAGSL